MRLIVPVITAGCEIHCTITGYYTSFEQNYAELLFLINALNVGFYAECANFR